MSYMANMMPFGMNIVSQESCATCSWREKLLDSSVYSKHSRGIPSLTRTPFNKAKCTAGMLTNLRLWVL